MEIICTCPLGHSCEKIVDDHIERCMWYIKMQGLDAQGNDHDSWNCALAWMPILQVEVAGTVRGQTAAVESLRNEQTKRQDQALRLIDARNIAD